MWNRMNNRAKRRRRKWPTGVFPWSTTNTSSSTARGLGFRGRSGSLTSTMMAMPYAVSRIRPSGTGSTFSSYNTNASRPHPKIRYIRRVAQKQYFQNVRSTRLAGTSFGQQSLDAFYVGRATEFHTMVTSVPNYDATTDIFIDTMTVETEFTNQSEATCYFDLYEVTPRYSFESTYDPVNVLDSGIQEQGVVIGIQELGIRPTAVKKFTYLYKIHKKFTIELGQGQSHRHVSNYDVRKRFNEAFYDVLGGSRQMPEFTKWLLVIASGAPLNDQTTKTNVSTAKPALDIVRKERYSFLFSQPAYTTYTFTNNLPTVTTGYIMDVGSGEAETVDAA